MSANIREKIDTVLSTEMDRTQFLKVCGLALLGIVGASGVLKALAGALAKPSPHSPGAPSNGHLSYGGRPLDE